jgi:hypothetical protein
MAFKQTFPEAFKKSFPSHEDILDVTPYGDIDVQADAISEWMYILSRWEKHLPDDLEKILAMVEGVLKFTKAIFVASEKAPVSITFI